eukprot:XP_001695471.1 predicted protein [Chlamydomonas reinhardtii]
MNRDSCGEPYSTGGLGPTLDSVCVGVSVLRPMVRAHGWARLRGIAGRGIVQTGEVTAVRVG